MIFHLNNDLMLSSSVRAAATQAGTPIQFGRKLDELTTALQSGQLTKVLIDLQTPGIDLPRLQEIVSQPGLPPIVMYAQHVNEDLLDFANSLPGVSVMTRGQFSRSASQLVSVN
jgi:DNA-binding NtrC family response regulator